MIVIKRKTHVIETNGNLNDIGRIARCLGFLPTAQRGLSPRSETYSGYFTIETRDGKVWHVIG